MATVMAAVGLFIIPARRRQGKNKMIERIASLRTQLVQSMRGSLRKRSTAACSTSTNHLAYTRFVRTEKEN